MPKTDKELTVEECLAELRTMFRRKRVYLDVRISGVCGPRGQIRVKTFPEIQIEDADGEIVYDRSSNRSLSLINAMAQVRAWRKSQP